MGKQKKKITLTCKVDAYRSGWTVVDFLAHRFPYHNADAWKQRVLDQQVLVNEAGTAPHGIVRRDDIVRYTIFHSEPEVDFRYDVVYEDEHLLAVSKSGNLPVHACGVYITHTLIAVLKEHYGRFINLAHRLDRETSGIVLLSKSKETARVLGKMFQKGEVTKKYVVITYGRVPDEQFEVDAPIGRIDEEISSETPPDNEDLPLAQDPERNFASYLPKRRVDFVLGKPARTRFVRLHYRGDFSGLEASPTTGRTNQIRVHLAHIGFPVVGDKVYGLTGNLKEECLKDGLTARVKEALVMERHALHCHELEFPHPVTNKPVCLTAPLPEDMKWVFE